MNCWELTKQLIQIDKTIENLMDKKQKSNEKWIDEELDRCLSKQLEIKHKLERVRV